MSLPNPEGERNLDPHRDEDVSIHGRTETHHIRQPQCSLIKRRRSGGLPHSGVQDRPLLVDVNKQADGST